MKNKKRFVSDKLKASFIISLFAVMLIGNGLIALRIDQNLPQDVQKSEKGIKYQVDSKDASTGLIEPLNAYPVTSTGSEVIRIKTPYELSEITIRMAAEQACKYVGLDSKQCREDLVGIAWTEVRNFDCLVPGDGSKSYGCFQIHLGYHPTITKAQAQDPYWAAIWTIKRMVAYGYPKQRDNAIRAHNGSINNPKTLAYLNTVNEFVYNK